MTFEKGEKVNVIAGKYKGQHVRVTDIHIGFNPVGYSCTTINNTEVFLFENELQSMYSHDIKMLDDEANL